MTTIDAPPWRTQQTQRSRTQQVVGGFVLAEATADGIQMPASRATVLAAVRRLKELSTHNEVISVDDMDRIAVRVGTRSRVIGRRRLQQLIRALVATRLIEGDEQNERHLDVAATWALIRNDDDAALRRLLRSSQRNLSNRDLMLRGAGKRYRLLRPSPFGTFLQVIVAYILSFFLPLAALVACYLAGFDISGYVYWMLVITLALTASMLWAEASLSIDPPPLPDKVDRPAPRATAIIAAYLPNEAATIMETLGHFLGQEYSGGLQVILAYNTPRPMPIELELRALEAANPNLRIVVTSDSTSKAQNVNAALTAVEGEFVGIFDADHHPMQGAFERAWRWIASGVDVVQGHCVVRNGDESFIAKMTSVEFEQIYAVSHPGRQLLHGFGIFGGSNGFWRVQVLREIRLRGIFLTEDIDASIRSVREGRRIVNDPGLISRELAPATLSALSKQRLRWAQGWFQVTLSHLHSTLSEGSMTGKQRRGLALLLGWREIFIWLTGLMWPVVLFFIWRDGQFSPTSTFLLLTTIFTLSSGPTQVYYAYRLGAPEIRKHKGRWFAYVFYALFFYQEYKNLLSRLAQVKHVSGERQWAVTPRTVILAQEWPAPDPSDILSSQKAFPAVAP